MKTFEQLPETAKQKAIEKCKNSLLEAICAGHVRFNDELNHDDLQKRIDKAAKHMERMQTPWFLPERIMEDKVCKQAIEGMAESEAMDAIYPEPGEQVIPGIL